MECVKPIFSMIPNLWNYSAVHRNYLFELDKNVSSLKSSLTRLKERRDDVKKKVERAEGNPTPPMKRTHEVGGWLPRVEALEQEVESILQEEEDANNEGGSYFCCWGRKNCFRGYKLGKSVVEKLKAVKQLREEGNFNTVVEESQPDPVREIATKKAVGMESQIEEIWSLLADETSLVRIIGLCGMGGVGKTTLLININNEFLKRDHDFDLVIWATVSRDRAEDTKNIQKQIGMPFGLSWSEETSIDDMAKDITKVLKNKKFVLLLDDIWKHIDLQRVGVPDIKITSQEVTKSRILFTTRSKSVCGSMQADATIEVNCLDPSDSWHLFKRNVGQSALSCHPHVHELATEVAEECLGLPLALITIGQTMASKKTLPEWKHALTVLRKSASKFSDMADKVLAIMKYSYDSLESEKLKSCFLYCCLFPEDYSFAKEEVIGFWIAEGFLDSVDDFVEAKNEGHDVIGCLKNACLLETGIAFGVKLEDGVKMHDVVRDLAIWIVSDLGRKKVTYLTLQAESTLKLHEWEKAERISLIDNKAIKVLNGAPRCSNLITLILRNSCISVLSDDFFRFMPMLKVLNMDKVELKKLPTSLFSLKSLEYLEFPKYDEEIVLKPGSLTSFKKLKILYLSDSCCQWEGEGAPSLLELESLQHLIYLEITIGSSLALQRLVASPKLQLCTKFLTIKYCPGIKSLTLLPSSPVSLLSLAHVISLTGLKLEDCDELEELRIMSWDEVTTLEILHLEFVPKLTILWDVPYQSLYSVNLRYVFITGCPQLKDITWLIYAQNLEMLKLEGMDGLEEIISSEFATEENLKNTFSRLNLLVLMSIRNLKRICDPNVKFNHLEKLEVVGCPVLKTLPFNTNSWIPRTLKRIEGEKEWWESLGWEDEATISNLAPYCYITI